MRQLRMVYLKNIFMIILCICSISAPSAFAKETLSILDFAQMTDRQKAQTLLIAQDLASQLESHQNKSIIQKRKYSEVRKFLDAIIKTSYAQDALSDDTQICIYAGWVSYIPKSRKTGCRHPGFINPKTAVRDLRGGQQSPAMDQVAELQGNYANAKLLTNKCAGAGKIVCNPDLFGYKAYHNKTGQGKEAFCVNGNVDPYNSSYKCSEAVRNQMNGKSHKEKDAYLAHIVDLAMEKETSVPKTGQLMKNIRTYYDICMCKGSQEDINQSYAKKMYPSRTCYAWMSQTSRILTALQKHAGACKELQSKPYDDYNSDLDWAAEANRAIWEELKDVNNSRENPQADFFSDPIIDKEFSDLRERKFKERKDKNICPLGHNPILSCSVKALEGGKYQVIGTLKQFTGRQKISDWSFTLAGSGSIKQDKTNFHIGTLAQTDEAQSVIVKFKDKGLVCPVTVPKKSELPTIILDVKNTTRDIENNLVDVDAIISIPEEYKQYEDKMTIEWSSLDKEDSDGIQGQIIPKEGVANTSMQAILTSKKYKIQAVLKIDSLEIPAEGIVKAYPGSCSVVVVSRHPEVEPTPENIEDADQIEEEKEDEKIERYVIVKVETKESELAELEEDLVWKNATNLEEDPMRAKVISTDPTNLVEVTLTKADGTKEICQGLIHVKLPPTPAVVEEAEEEKGKAWSIELTVDNANTSSATATAVVKDGEGNVVTDDFQGRTIQWYLADAEEEEKEKSKKKKKKKSKKKDKEQKVDEDDDGLGTAGDVDTKKKVSSLEYEKQGDAGTSLANTYDKKTVTQKVKVTLLHDEKEERSQDGKITKMAEKAPTSKSNVQRRQVAPPNFIKIRGTINRGNK